ncbi:MAG: dTMP kinase [Verrucomicrobiota bacterium]|nr:dTMP kinase [Verrucomicrobiota bacterium]
MALFITFEGGEAVGKTTQIALLADKLRSLNREVVLTREPGGTPLGEELRNLLKFHPAGKNMSPEAELLLFAAARAQHAREVILPALKAGKTVLCDRYSDSTTAYQGAARKLAPAQVAQINSFAVAECIPDITLYLDLDPALARRRMIARSKPGDNKDDRMESEPLDFYQKVRESFLKIAAAEPDRVHSIDAQGTIGEISAKILDIVGARLNL